MLDGAASEIGLRDKGPRGVGGGTGLRLSNGSDVHFLEGKEVDFACRLRWFFSVSFLKLKTSAPSKD
jgi:hypothetical protein